MDVEQLEQLPKHSDVEVLLQRRGVRLWVIDFNLCNRFSMDDAFILGHEKEVLSQLVLAFFENDPYYSLPLMETNDPYYSLPLMETNTEIIIRELEVLAGYVERAKKTNEALDPRKLEESAIKEFVQKLEKPKQNMGTAIEQLYAERNELVDENNQAAADRDRASMEFEQLSSKNAHLAGLNNDLTHQIQERFKHQANISDLRSPNGLGIYGHAKGDVEDQVVEGPTVINIRKGQVKKFN
ncbi:hypothetical protein B0T24DRAFT_712052 [Lasiosphaeria ovina]|uniref:DUF3669 domain-containing protein n=1 Tax=Lasiosphaeria ovina TaxID=92902 RepID=A0AAE0JUX5_9PEZI|nr:hypothetical protein B0T24DRAFT_712052 [Lasiosphaeria ovina]